MKVRIFATVILLALTGCASTGATVNDILEATRIQDDQCGTAKISGNVKVGGRFGIFGTDIHVDIEKEKPVYTDSQGSEMKCE